MKKYAGLAFVLILLLLLIIVWASLDLPAIFRHFHGG